MHSTNSRNSAHSVNNIHSIIQNNKRLSRTTIIPILSPALFTIATLSIISITNIANISSTTKAYADDVTSSTTTDTTTSTTASVTVSSSCTMTGTINTPHTATVAGGTYTENIGKTTIKTFCNDPNGYALYAIGYTPTTANPTGEYGNTILKGTSTENTISTGVYSSGTTTSSWSMKLNATGTSYVPTIENSFDSYSVVPSTFTKVATYANNTDIEVNGSGTGSSVETTYAAYISSTQAADTYTGQVKYVLVHPNTTVAGQYTIAYDANGGTGTTTGHTGVYNFEPVTLNANGFTRNGYNFLGWCTTSTSETSCLDGTLYKAGDTATSLGSANSTATLYAIWTKLPTMQEFSSDDAAKLNVGDSTTLVDSRDGQSYTVAKLADNKIWMTKNLNLAGGTALSSDDTDFEPTYTLPTTNGWTVSTDGKLVLPVSDPTGFGTDNYAYVYNSDNVTDNCTSSQACYSYYSWDAATLGSGRTIAAENTDAPYSICPSGWRLPTSGASSSNGWKRGDFYVLATACGANLESNYYEYSSTFYNNAGPGTTPNFLLAGYYYGGSFYDGGLSGYYWSATSSSLTSNARSLAFSSSDVYSTYSNGRRSGYSVRCVFGS